MKIFFIFSRNFFI